MKRLLTALCVITLVILTGCTHTTPFTEDYYFRALGEKNEVVVTVNVEEAEAIIEEVTAERDLSSVEPIIERTERISVAIDPSVLEPAEEEEESTEAEEDRKQDELPKLYGGIEGNFGKIVTDTVLKVSKDFDTMEREETSYFSSEAMGLDVKVPHNGLILFSNDDITDVYRKTYRERELFIPYEVSQRMAESLFGIYMENPHDIGFLTDQIPRPMLLSMNSIWLVLNGQKDDYRVSGTLQTSTAQASRVLGTMLRLNYLKTIRKLENPIEGWEEHILAEDTVINLTDMYISNEEVYDLLNTVMENL